ncbi:MAG TPA: hypothetical protein VLA56_19870 [Pseudomonadales bacterium]|nr:hypothetical protein [Pseudomonadales bacterium]
MNDEDVIPLHGDGLSPEQARDLDARLASLSVDVPPPTDQWQAIATRLPPRGAARTVPDWRRFAVAASIATLALLLGLTLLDGGAGAPGRDLAQGAGGQAPAAATSAGEAAARAITDPRIRPAALPASLGGRDALGDGFIRVRARVSTNFAERLETLDPATRAVVETNLNVIHDALGRIEQSLAADPNDTLLQELLMSTWRSELDYMGQVSRMPEPLNRRIEL